MQENWLSKEQQKALVDARDFTVLQSLMDQQERGETDIPHSVTTESNETYSIPYLTADSMVFFEALDDNQDYYREMRKWLRFSGEECCASAPDDDEIVFHFRNFRTWFAKARSVPERFQEANPTTVAKAIFGNHTNESRIAIVTISEDGLDPYLDALRGSFESTRLVVNQSSVQDFCFLMKTKREFVGFHHSTFARWAALLGDAKLNRLYLLKESELKGWFKSAQHADSRKFVVEKYEQLEEEAASSSNFTNSQ